MTADGIEARVRAGALLGGPVVVLFSGGRDSTCLLDLAVRIAGPDAVTALHVDYGLRTESADDAAHCERVCAALRIRFVLHRAGAPAGNVQAWARDVRYAKAERLDGDIATGHTATDQVETVLYRLAASPGRRALLGMREREGRVVRPLLHVTREETAAYCGERGLPWREDASNDSDAYARNRIRHRLLEALREIHPAAEANVLRTLATLRDEAAVLDDLVAQAIAAGELAALPPALARLALQRLADEAAGGRAPAIAARAEEILALSPHGTASLDLGQGLRVVSEYGRLRFETSADDAPRPDPVELPVPGRVPFGAGEVVAGSSPGDVTIAARGPLAVRARRPGDRMRPVGRGGSRSLQDLFVDHKIPRAARPQWPVVTCGGEIAWVPQIAVDERFAATTGVTLAWRQ
jgi:tRNA(Ile)-lysidine synthase